MYDTVIVVPCYNEAQRLNREAFEGYVEVSTTERFLFVNDGSTDETLERLQELASHKPERFSVLDLSPNGGKAEAVRRGMAQAFQEGATFAGYWDADLATPLEAIPNFRTLLVERPELSMVFGSRVRLLGRYIERQAVRHYLGRVGATLASLVLGLPIYDTQCGAKLFRRSDLVEGLFERPFKTGWMFDVEILARFISGLEHAGGGSAADAIYELPLVDWHDVAGSKVKAGDFPKAFLELATIYFTHRV